MRHNKKINHLGRTHSHRKAMLSNMAVSLIVHKRIFTTVAKAKELRKYVEPIISKSKQDTTHSRRLVFQQLHDKYATTELFQDIAQKIGDRSGGYTRIIKTGNRLGDNAEMCFIELVDYNDLMLNETMVLRTTISKTRRSRRNSGKSVIANQIRKTGNSKKNQTNAYDNAKMVPLVGFRNIYPELEPPTIESLLLNIPREKIIRVVQVLDQLYKNAGIVDMQKFFSPQNETLKKDFNMRFEKLQNTGPNVNYNFCVIQTSVELLKQSFSIPYKNQEAKEENFEENLLKAILIINDKIMDFKLKKENKNPSEQITELMVVNSFSQNDINIFDYNEVSREISTKSVDLFEYVSTDEYFSPIYKRFLEKLNIQDYKDYIKSILGLLAIIHKNGQSSGTFHYDPNNNPEQLIKISVLDYVSLPFDKDITLTENEDYKVFRDKPLIKMQDGSYEITNVRFVLERLFSSLYFDFKAIAKELVISGFEDQYKQNFMEKTLLCKYLEMINDSQQYKSMSSADSLAIKQKYDNGEPDYYMRSSNNAIILFENKDIMINGAVKESRDLDKIIFEYKNKLLLKTHSNLKPVEKPKPEGIGQLIEQIKKIQQGDAFWDKDAPQKSVIYPVLVVGDSKLLPDGLPYLMQKWYEDRCVSENVDIKTAKPLIVLSISTLLLYAEEFREKGFEHYFEEYYKSIESAQNNPSNDMLLDSVNSCISVSEYMKKVYSKDFSPLFDLYKNKIFSDPTE
jgi:ribosomal protein L17